MGLVEICPEWLQHQCFKTHFLNTEDIKQRIAYAEAHPGKFQSNQMLLDVQPIIRARWIERACPLDLLPGGSAQALSRRGVKGVHDSVTLGDGACRVLHLLFQQDAQMPLKSSLHHADYEALCLRERERFRKVAMNVFGGNEALILSPVREDPSVPCSTI